MADIFLLSISSWVRSSWTAQRHTRPHRSSSHQAHPLQSSIFQRTYWTHPDAIQPTRVPRPLRLSHADGFNDLLLRIQHAKGPIRVLPSHVALNTVAPSGIFPANPCPSPFALIHPVPLANRVRNREHLAVLEQDGVTRGREPRHRRPKRRVCDSPQTGLDQHLP